ncbi:MAG: hypothetical protein RBT45_06015 [Acholeplasmataceae bacterium]|jgi:hypothetical protein|nr:hypothetical protein [Acholeplasmataceae bacterium]
MKDVYVISLVALIYAIIVSLIAFIFFNQYDYPLWTVLGSAVALFNHSLMIQVTKKMTTQRLVTHLIQRYVFYTVIIAYVYLQTRNLGTEVMIKSFIFLLVGIFSIKFGILIYHTPIIRKPAVHKEEEHE